MGGTPEGSGRASSILPFSYSILNVAVLGLNNLPGYHRTVSH